MGYTSREGSVSTAKNVAWQEACLACMDYDSFGLLIWTPPSLCLSYTPQLMLMIPFTHWSSSLWLLTSSWDSDISINQACCTLTSPAIAFDHTADVPV